MDFVQTYSRLVSSYATRLTDNRELRREFCQDAYLRIHQLSRMYPEESSRQSEFWRKQVHVAVRNLMVDNARKNSNRRKYYAAAESPERTSLVDTLRDPGQNQFEALVVRNSLEELYRVLPENGKRVLREILDPSPEITQLLRKRAAVQKIWTRATGRKLADRLRDAVADPAIARHLQIEPDEFKQHIARINFFVTKHFQPS